MSLAPTVALVGATATGKTGLGEALARALDADVVCADSRQVFAELEIGTGKPTVSERAAWPHHLFDTLMLGDRASAGWFAGRWTKLSAELHARRRRALLVGGSGLYLKAARSGLAAVPPIDPVLRARLNAELEAEGPEALYARLTAVDPRTAARLAPRDRQRITRALEVLEGTGATLSTWLERHDPAPAEPWIVIELTADPGVLDTRIADRTHWMFAHGLVEETAALVAAGKEPLLRSLRAVGYDEALDLLGGRIDRAEAEASTTRRTRQLAKRQRTWFRHQIEAIRIDGDATSDELLRLALAAIERAGALRGE